MLLLKISVIDLQGHPQLQDFPSHQEHQVVQQHLFHQCDQKVQSHHGCLSGPPFQGVRKVLGIQSYPETKNQKH